MIITLSLLDAPTIEFGAQNYACIMYLRNPSGGLASHSMGVGGAGASCFSNHDNPYCAGPLAFFYDLSHPSECTTIKFREGEGMELLYSFLVASHLSNQDKLLLCRPLTTWTHGVDYHPIY